MNAPALDARSTRRRRSSLAGPLVVVALLAAVSPACAPAGAGSAVQPVTRPAVAPATPMPVQVDPIASSAPTPPRETPGPWWPGATWDHVATPEEIGWSSTKLQAARDYSATTNADAVFIVVGGKVLTEWGETAKKFNVHSIRKSLLSALYGIRVAEGRIDLSRTLGSLGVDDNEPSLDATEKKATVRDLLEARSGVYHAALYSPATMKAGLPRRHSHAPGTFWYYNNWDFNALGTIYEHAAKDSIYRDFEARIARPLGMEDYKFDDGAYVTGPESVHPAYPFRMTARDLARFGLLYLRRGAWKGEQIVPEAWIAESLRPWTDIGTYHGGGGYGYLWWVTVDGKHLPGISMPAGSFSARGAGGHFLLVVPAYDLIIVQRVNTDIDKREVKLEQFAALVKLIFDARPQRAEATEQTRGS